MLHKWKVYLLPKKEEKDQSVWKHNMSFHENELFSQYSVLFPDTEFVMNIVDT